jgi:hypothetical protein
LDLLAPSRTIRPVDVKASPYVRFLAVAAVLAAMVSACAPPQTPRAPPERPAPSRAPDHGPPSSPSLPSPVVEGDCGAAGAAGADNARTLQTLAWRPFGRDELGWETYVPLIGREIGTACPPQSARFAERLAAWQQAAGRPATGRIGEADFQDMKTRWQGRRPFVQLASRGLCPAPPPETSLVMAKIEEGYGGKAVRLRPGALDAYRRMVATARKEAPEAFADRNAFTIFSAFRDPDADAARCLRDRNCDGVRRATCSPHRTGLALDLYVGAAPGFGPDSSADLNRRHQTTTGAYLWLVKNADRFGFVNYPFEPWHWEWTGEAP